MTGKWWQRLFGLEADPPEEEPKHIPPNPGRGRLPVGRFEDTRRRVTVKMASYYPEGDKRAAESNWQGSLRRQEPGAGKNGTKNDFRMNHPERPVSNDRHDKKIKPPFRVSQVPSPVFGFKKPPEDFYRTKSSEHVYLDPQKEAQEKRQIFEKLDRSNKNNERLHRSHRLPSLQDRPTVDPKWVEKPALERRSVKEAPYGARRNDDGIERVPEASTRREAPGRPSPGRDEASHANRQVPSGSGQMRREGISKENSETVRTVRSRLPRSPYRPHGSSKVPFNVLMFHSDRHRSKWTEDKEQKNDSSDNKADDPGDREGLQLPLDLLDNPPEVREESTGWIAEKQQVLTETLTNFHVKADIVGHVQGPSVTRFDIHLHPGVKINKVLSLSEDLKLSLAVRQIRIAPVPGRSAVGIEIPNDRRKPVYLKQIMDSDAFLGSRAPLTAALGQDVSGKQIITDLAKMPHGLIAGATGSGKSVCIHSLILSLIYKTPPDRLRLLLIDPKVVELAPYQKLPHLAAPVITEPKDAARALKWAVDEMEKRYRLFARSGVRDIDRYNSRAAAPKENDERLPYLVIIIDELADLMMVSPQEVEEAICRIAQKARAAGIHLLLATQRPSVDVLTGLIKANIPARIAFSVSSQADSRTILDSGGAERLLGRGDMLFAENGARSIKRLQGCYVSDAEIERVIDAFRDRPAPDYLFDAESLRSMTSETNIFEDELFHDAAAFVVEQGQASVSSLQRHFRIGYNRAARLVDELEAKHVVSAANGSKPRQVLMTKENLEQGLSNDKI
ncbi:DNA translocase FtsK [Sporolactobacillus sp. THM7-7]|nr:DNA translocase FtsK [Sporolactobacillus sp. THM7-7]